MPHHFSSVNIKRNDAPPTNDQFFACLFLPYEYRLADFIELSIANCPNEPIVAEGVNHVRAMSISIGGGFSMNVSSDEQLAYPKTTVECGA